MKIIKLFAAASAALGLLASCQQQEVENLTNQEELVPVSLTASFNTVETKVSYTETTTDGIKLQPAWKVGDKVIGFDEATPTKNTYTFTVSKVDGSGVATLDGACPSSCTLHLIYLCGAAASSIKNGTLAVSYDNQAGTGDSNHVYTMPAVMLADGEVAFGSGDFHFSNAGAVIGVKAVKGVPNGSTISKITVSGENLSGATISLEGGTLKLTATPKTGDSITITPVEGLTVKDDNGTLSTNPILIAVPAGAVVSKVSATTDKGIFDFTLASPSTLEANQYSYVKNQTFGHEYVEIGGLKWATMNVGATTVASSPSTCYGHYFFWGGTEGYEYDSTNEKWVKASDHTTELDGGFCFENSPHWKTTGFTKYVLSTDNTTFWAGEGSPDNKLVLDPEDDAAYANWGGEWRMPTKEDFQKLYEACGGTGSPTVLNSSTPNKGIYWVDKDQTHISDYTGVAGLLFCDGEGHKLFFPAAGSGSDFDSLDSAGSKGVYLSSSLDSSVSYGSYCLGFHSGLVSPHGFSYRYYGQSVRPVSD